MSDATNAQPPQAVASRATYFERPLPIALVFAAFFLISLPLGLLLWIPNFVECLPYLLLLEIVGLGTSHFFITLAVYLQAENRDYFMSCARNRLIYVATPLAIFVLLATSEALRWPSVYPALVTQFFRSVRLFDFFHVGRQSAGMLQIWKRPLARTGAATAPRRLENAFFVGMALLQWQTFLGDGRFAANNPYALVAALALGGIFVAIAISYARLLVNPAARRQRPWLPLGYFSAQAICSAAAVYQTRLYLVALAMHYLEYHVIMAPRCFRSALEPTRPSNRPLLWLRTRPLVFYLGLASVAVLFELRSIVPTDASATTTFFVHAFDGIFLVHYVLEAFLWKFGNPFYRRTLAPLYFEAWPAARADEPRARAGSSARALGWAAGAALLGLAVLARDRVGSFVQGFERRAIAPMQVEQHLNWGVELARRGELRSAQRHFQDALRHDPNDNRAQQAVRWAERKLTRPQ